MIPTDTTPLSIFAHRGSMAISRLSSEDTYLFRAAFQQEPARYCNSWLYLLRSTRNDQGEFGYKFAGKNALIAIGHRNNTFYLVHPMGSERFSATLDLCHAIQQNSSCTIVLKKLDQDLYSYLLASDLFRRSTAHSTTAFSNITLEEEAFPEHLLHLDTLCDINSNAYQKSAFIKKVKRFEKYSLSLSGTNDIEHQDFSTLFSADSEKNKCYRQMIAAVTSHQDAKYKTCIYCDKYGVAHGLYIAETLATGVMGLYCAVGSKKAPGITEWMDHDFFQQLYQQGIHILYLGGSETQGVDTYIKKLFPIAPPYLLRPMVIVG
jgi:hypothetical protein